MKIETVAVVGAGIMGAQIGQVLAASGFQVCLQDVRDEALQGALREIEHGRYGLRRGIERGKITEDGVDAALQRITVTTELQVAARDADLVIEAVPERLDLKLELFRRLDELTNAAAILASNTAGLPITALAHATRRPQLVLGWHWATPCALMRFAEIVRHPGTAQEAIDAVVAAAERCGKNPEVIRDQPLHWGFVANRIMLAARREALRIVAEGVATPEQVDALVKDCFRWPVGPFEGLGDLDAWKERPEAELLK